MWICPVCQKENIDNAHRCLHCSEGRLCFSCGEAFLGDVCKACGKEEGGQLWLSEKEYEEYIASALTASADEIVPEKDEAASLEDADNIEASCDTLNSEETEKTIIDIPVVEIEELKVSDSQEAEEHLQEEKADEMPETEDIEESEDISESEESAEIQETEDAPEVCQTPDEGKEINASAKTDDEQAVSEDTKDNTSKGKTFLIIIAFLIVAAIVAAVYYYIYLPGHRDETPSVPAGSSTVEADAPSSALSDGSSEIVADVEQTSGIAADSSGENAVSSDGLVAQENLSENESYDKAKKSFSEGDYTQALNEFRNVNSYNDSRYYMTVITSSFARYISAGYDHTLGLKKNGTVVSAGSDKSGKRNVDNWSSVVGVSARGLHSVGVKNDGTVVATGSNDKGQCNVSSWSNVADAKAGSEHTLAMTNQGTVLATGNNDYGQCNVSSWSNVIGISAGARHSVALKKDGTVVAIGDNKYGQCDVSGWTNIIQISAGDWYTVGLKSDGTVVSVGNNNSGQRNLSNWKDVVYVSAGLWHTVGLKADGTVVAAGSNKFGECNVSYWTNVVAISAGGFHYTTALLADGTVLAIGDDADGQCGASSWWGISL